MRKTQAICDRCGVDCSTTATAINALDLCSPCAVSYWNWLKTQHACWAASDGKIGCVAKCVQCGEQKRVYNGKRDPYTSEHVNMTCEQCAGGPHCEKCGTPVPQHNGHKAACMFSKQDLCDTCHLEVVKDWYEPVAACCAPFCTTGVKDFCRDNHICDACKIYSAN